MGRSFSVGSGGDGGDGLERFFDRLEDAWHNDPPRQLSAEDLCFDAPEYLDRVQALYPQWWQEVQRGKISNKLREAVADNLFIDWKALVGEDPELLAWAQAKLAVIRAVLDPEPAPRRQARTGKLSPAEVAKLIAQANATLNLTDFEGSPDAHYAKHPNKPIERHFEITGVAGKGGFGVVFEARDHILNRPVAIKKVLPEHRNASKIHDRLVREAKIVAKLEHPGIVPVYSILHRRDLDDREVEPAFVMRLLPKTRVRDRGQAVGPGEDQPAATTKDFDPAASPPLPTKKLERPSEVVRRLKDDIDDFHRRTEPWNASDERLRQFQRLLERFVEVCHAIAAAHDHHVIHRDVKPSNVVIGPHGETLVIDWGISKVLADEEGVDPELSRIASVVADPGWEYDLKGTGTPAYASPEQMGQHDARQDHDEASLRRRLSTLEEATVRQPADVFSLGATLYSILTGKVPAPRRRHEARFAEFPAWVPQSLRQVVAKATAFRPWHRYIGAAERRWFEEHDLIKADASISEHDPQAQPGEVVLQTGVEQLREAVQNWLDDVARTAISEPLEREIEVKTSQLAQTQVELAAKQQELAETNGALTETKEDLTQRVQEVSQLQVREQSLKRTRRRLVAVTSGLAGLAVIALLVVGFGSVAVQRLTTQRNQLSTEIEKERKQKDRLVEEAAELQGQLATSRSQIEGLRVQAKVVTQEKERARFLRDSNLVDTALALIKDYRFAEAARSLNQVADSPDTFAWNFAWHAAATTSVETFRGVADGVREHTGAVIAVAVSPDGQHYLTFGSDGRLLTWDAATHVPVREALIGPTAGKVGLGIDVVDDRVFVLSLPAGMPAAALGTIQLQDEILAVGDSMDALMPVKGRQLSEIDSLIDGTPGTSVFVRLQREGAEPQVVEIPRQATTTVMGWQLLQRFSPDARWLAVGATLDKDSVAVWLVDTSSGEIRKQWTLAKSFLDRDTGSTSVFSLQSLNFSQDSRRLLIAGALPGPSEAGDVPAEKGIVVDLTSSEFHQIDEQASTRFSPVGWVLSADGQAAIGIGLIATTPFGRWEIRKHADPETSASTNVQSLGSMGDHTPASPSWSAVSPDGAFLVMAGLDKPVQVLTGDGAMQLVSLGAPGSRRAAVFSANNTMLAIANGLEIDIYETRSWRRLAQIPFDMTYQAPGVHPAIAFTLDNQNLLVGSADGFQAVSLDAIFSRPGMTSLGNLSHFKAAKWTSGGTLWVAQDGGVQRSGMIAVREIRPDGSVAKTLCDSLGSQHPPAVMSRNGEQVFVPRTFAEWATESRLEAWELNPEPNLKWSYTSAGAEARPVRDRPDGSMLVEFSTSRFGEPRDRVRPGLLHRLGEQGGQLERHQTTGSPVWRLTPLGDAIFVDPTPKQALASSPSGTAKLWVGNLGDGNRRALVAQAINAVVSDDGKFLAAVIVSPEQAEGSYGALTVYRLPDFECVATLKDRPIVSPIDFGLNFSPDGTRVVVGTRNGELIVWEYLQDKLVMDGKWQAESWMLPWVTGATFTDDGQRLVVSAFDLFEFMDPNRIGRNIDKLRGGLGVVSLSDEAPAIRPVRDDVGLIVLGEASVNRQRVSSTNVVTGEVRVWDISQGDPQELARIIDERTGVYDKQWTELATVRAIAPSADGTRVAVVGPVLTLNAAKSRIVVFDVATRRVIRSADCELGVFDDLAWFGDEVRALSHEPFAEGKEKRVRLIGWKLPDEAPHVLAEYGDIGPIQLADGGLELRPRFDHDGARFAFPVLNRDPQTQTVAIHTAGDGHELSRPSAALPMEALQAFDWTSDGRIVLSTIVASESTRHLAVWNPANNDYVRFTVENAPSEGNAIYNTGFYHLAMSPDGDSIAIQKWNSSRLDVWSVSQQEFVSSIRLESPAVLARMQFSPTGDALLMAGQFIGGQILRSPRPVRSQEPVTP